MAFLATARRSLLGDKGIELDYLKFAKDFGRGFIVKCLDSLYRMWIFVGVRKFYKGFGIFNH